jgi:hypothetical protein
MTRILPIPCGGGLYPTKFSNLQGNCLSRRAATNFLQEFAKDTKGNKSPRLPLKTDGPTETVAILKEQKAQRTVKRLA